MKNTKLARNLRPLSEEMDQAIFRDKRLSQRLGVIVDAISNNCGESLPKAMGSERALARCLSIF